MKKFSRTKFIGSLFLSTVVTVIFLMYFFRALPPDAVHRVRSAWKWTPIFLYIICSITGGLFRALRYKALLIPVRVPFIPLLLITFVRNFTVDLLPMRLGSLTYPGLLRFRLRTSWSSALSSYFWAIIWDLYSLSIFLMGASLSLSLQYAFAYTLLSISILFFCILTFFMTLPDTGLQWLGACIFRYRKIPLIRKIRKLFPFQKTVRTSLLTGRLYPWTKTQAYILLYTLIIRALKYTSLYILYAFFISVLDPTSPIMGWDIFIWTITGAELTSALPIQGIMNIGPWETAWTSTLQFLNLHSKKIGIVLSSFVHWSTQILEYTIGFLSLGLLFGIPWHHPSQSERKMK